MAGKKISQIYCWKFEIDGLNIYTASSKRGAVRIGVSLDNTSDCVEYFKALFPRSKVIKNKDMNKGLVKATKRVLQGKITSPVPTDIGCTLFQHTVLKRITMIPLGETRTYGDVARIIGKPKGARAIGQVMNKNPLPLIYP